MTSREKILLPPYKKDKEETYFNYHKTAQEMPYRDNVYVVTSA